MHRAAIGLLLISANAFPHDGHGAPLVHLHWWEYGLIVAAVAALAAWRSKR